jgi:Cellulose biosynthesis protein BcsS
MFRLLLCMVASVVFATSSVALAANTPPLAVKAPDADEADENEHVELYSGLDVASRGWFYGWIEATDAPFTNNDTSGLRLRLYSEAGQYQYQSETFAGATNRENWYNTDFLIGYAYERENFSAAVYVGAAVVTAQLSSPDPNNPVQGTQVGPIIDAEFERVFAHNLVAGEGFYTTAFNTYEVKLECGRELFKNIYVGPQVAVIGDDRFVQWRVGGQVTAMNVHVTKDKDIRLAIGLGYENDSDNGSGAYGTIQAGIEF